MQTNLILVKESIQTIEQLKLWEIPQEMTKEQWSEGHKQLLIMQQVVKKLLPKSQSFGVLKFGLESFVEAEASFQLEFQLMEAKAELELEQQTEPIKRDEENNIFDYLEQGFIRWAERCGDMSTWDDARLQKTLKLLKPITNIVDRVHSIIEKRGGVVGSSEGGRVRVDGNSQILARD